MWQRLDKFFDLPAAQQRETFYTTLLLSAFRLGLWLVPFRFLRLAAQGSTIGSRRCDEKQSLHRVATNIGRVHPVIPGASCLTQALTAQVLLRRDGLIPTMRIGVARGENGEFKAHAWIEYAGLIVVGGGEDLPSFSQLNNSAANSVSS